MSGRMIRFRVWESSLNAYDSSYVNRPNGVLAPIAGLCMSGRYYPAGTEIILEQWTGLLDADNRDIYEGDIISFSTYGHPHGPESDDVKGGVVWWDIEEAAFAFGRWTHPHCDEPFDYGYAPCQIHWSTVRVIGNIHEHSHLITP